MGSKEISPERFELDHPLVGFGQGFGGHERRRCRRGQGHRLALRGRAGSDMARVLGSEEPNDRRGGTGGRSGTDRFPGKVLTWFSGWSSSATGEASPTTPVSPGTADSIIQEFAGV
ncbi:hypothetical protein [Actinosynnema sp. NPDC023587]|uniref:hypothetical protein n=1 Tax=Actinosynnema sp. NPDC023587 TaxID=3154695 RepID=UPI0033E94C85